MCVSRPVLLHHHCHNHPPSVVVLAERLTGCLSTELKCLHGSGLPPILWLPPIDLFQETLVAGRPEIKEERVGVQRKEGHFTGVPFRLCCSSHFFLFLSFCGSYVGLECVETFRKEQQSAKSVILVHKILLFPFVLTPHLMHSEIYTCLHR